MILQYYADSLGMARPGMVSMEQRYIQHLSDWLRQRRGHPVCVMDRAQGGATLVSLHEQFGQDETYIVGQKDILIVHAGIVDCAPRPVPIRVRKAIGRLPTPMRNRIVQWLHDNRSRLMESGFRYYLTDRSVFSEAVGDWLGEAVKSFRRVYVFTIAPTNAAVERHSPGLGKSIESYNQALRTGSEPFLDHGVQVIDVKSIFEESGEELDNLIDPQDGHHLTALAHRLCADALIRLEQALFSA